MATKATKTPVKKPAKKTTGKTKKASKPAAVSTATLKSFRPVKEHNFFTFKISLQTVYWTVLIVVIIALQLMIINAQLEAANSTAQLYDQLQSNK